MCICITHIYYTHTYRYTHIYIICTYANTYTPTHIHTHLSSCLNFQVYMYLLPIHPNHPSIRTSLNTMKDSDHQDW